MMKVVLVKDKMSRGPFFFSLTSLHIAPDTETKNSLSGLQKDILRTDATPTLPDTFLSAVIIS